MSRRERREGREGRGRRCVGLVVARQVHGVADLHVVREARVHEGAAADGQAVRGAGRGRGTGGGGGGRSHRLRQRTASSAASASRASTSAEASAACSAPPSAAAGAGARVGGRGASPPIILYLSVGGHVAPSRHAQNGVPSSSGFAATQRTSAVRDGLGRLSRAGWRCTHLRLARRRRWWGDSRGACRRGRARRRRCSGRRPRGCRWRRRSAGRPPWPRSDRRSRSRPPDPARTPPATLCGSRLQIHYMKHRPTFK